MKKKLLPSDYLKKGWCRGEAAVDSKGWGVPVRSRKAVAWCAIGSMIRAGIGEEIRNRLTPFLRDAIGTFGIADWNDEKCKSKREAVSKMRLAEKRAGLRPNR